MFDRLTIFKYQQRSFKLVCTYLDYSALLIFPASEPMGLFIRGGGGFICIKVWEFALKILSVFY